MRSIIEICDPCGRGISTKSRCYVDGERNHCAEVTLGQSVESEVVCVDCQIAKAWGPLTGTRVVNKKAEAFDVYIGRGSKWGNPYKIGPDGTRAEVIAKYREYAINNEQIMRSLHELRGKRLGCFCAPLDCHGMVLVEFIEFQEWVRRRCLGEMFAGVECSAYDNEDGTFTYSWSMD